MIDLHTHTFFSDGVLVPSELVRRAEYKGIQAIGITDHGDLSNIDFIIPRIVAVSDQLNQALAIRVIPGIELTHIPPSQIKHAASKARELGAKLVIVHGETIVEPVAQGTNHAALNADIDILAHPGLIDESDVILAREKGIFLEITARKGHSLTNGHVAALSLKCGAGMVINTDSHEPGDLIDKDFAIKVILGAGLNTKAFAVMQKNAERFI
ncbi:MAG: histidinol phosphate phosphatase domain-containing protein [Proteobacteria bacterium]|nr:histidinol phosphate phosphatase domain-containing protein [Pseudomonadota bacterium]